MGLADMTALAQSMIKQNTTVIAQGDPCYCSGWSIHSLCTHFSGKLQSVVQEPLAHVLQRCLETRNSDLWMLRRRAWVCALQEAIKMSPKTNTAHSTSHLVTAQTMLHIVTTWSFCMPLLKLSSRTENNVLEVLLQGDAKCETSSQEWAP